MKRYAKPGLPLAGTGFVNISRLGLEWLLFPYRHLFFPNLSPGKTCSHGERCEDLILVAASANELPETADRVDQRLR